MRKLKCLCNRSRGEDQGELVLLDIPSLYSTVLKGFCSFLRNPDTSMKEHLSHSPLSFPPNPLHLSKHRFHPLSSFATLHVLSLSLIWRLLILLSSLEEAQHSDSPWPLISPLTDRQHSPRWRAHRMGRETAGARQLGNTESVRLAKQNERKA